MFEYSSKDTICLDILVSDKILSRYSYVRTSVHWSVCCRHDKDHNGAAVGTKIDTDISLVEDFFGIEHERNKFLNKKVVERKSNKNQPFWSMLLDSKNNFGQKKGACRFPS